LFFLGLTIAFYVMSPKIAGTATPVEAMGMIVGITGCLCQSIAIVGLTTVTWPEAFKAIAGPSQVLLLDLEGFAITCFVSVPTSLRYIGTTLLFPAGVLWLLLCFLMTSQVMQDQTEAIMGQDNERHWAFFARGLWYHERVGVEASDVL
jgi:hypothetical protein